ncbi:Oidioi.mRNA.OKI2018_I69.PAR.g11016.t1.cds [Oikopleura dioica]|uniref:Oidioi.mRNA.OKI2018_I69.PAR.g11016.t1.cds n=1 Tax=Oikopleura dioica TaxID=34765 RepID=A0ABN7RX48_OIKDI|nr:Oidioi.mRNA.OKI2018_I69.PAR.g11016.t1.cds [Oikopleura dioica]
MGCKISEEKCVIASHSFRNANAKVENFHQRKIAMENDRKAPAAGRRKTRDSVKNVRQKNASKITKQSTVDESKAPNDSKHEDEDLQEMIVTANIQRGLSRVSIRKPRKPAGDVTEEKLADLNLKRRDLTQELKDLEFQLSCITSLLAKEITANRIVEWCRDHGQFVGISIKSHSYLESDF